ncbi:OpgC family protein [Pararhodobacter sp.]|uniref:OpgC family protein n=1 Tax=Pararhodobacter sp. TaxID=2127056 RepID=UPI002FDD14A5
MPSAPARDHRIDVVRGLALVMIFINHVPGTLFERLTSRNFGFSDAAEAFVLLAGVSAALAYGRRFSAPPWWPGVSKVWSRAWTLYLVHLLISMVALAIVASMARWSGSAQMMLQDNFRPLYQDPLGVYIGLPTMLHQFGYVNILPLYVLFLLAAPAALWLGLRRPMWVLALSVGLWVLAGVTRVNLLTYPGMNGWFLNPLAWQLLFMLGLLIGLRLKDGARLVPVHPVLVALAAVYVVMALLWVKVPAVREFLNTGMVWLSRQGAPRLITHFDKGHLEVPRLLHVLALAYLISVWPWFRARAGGVAFWALAVMGRQALAVFALGTILSFVARALRELWTLGGNTPSFAIDAAIILGGILLQLAFAALKDRLKPRPSPRDARQPVPLMAAEAPEKAAVNSPAAPPLPRSVADRP